MCIILPIFLLFLFLTCFSHCGKVLAQSLKKPHITSDCSCLIFTDLRKARVVILLVLFS